MRVKGALSKVIRWSVLASIVILAVPGPGEAGVGPSPFKFGMIGLTAGQTARLNVVNSSDTERAISCTAVLLFLDSAGNNLTTPSEFMLGPGQSAFADLDADTLLRAAPRIQIRAVVRVAVPPTRCLHEILPTLEVFDNLTGKTLILHSPISD